MAALFASWGYILCAGLCAVVAVFIGRRQATQASGKMLVAALSLTAIWALATALGAFGGRESGVLESLRNCGWLVCLFVVPGRFGPIDMRATRGASALYSVLLLLLVGQSVLAIITDGVGLGVRAEGTSALLRVIWALGALLLIQRVYVACGPQARARFAPVAAGLAAMWGYDLLLYAVSAFGATAMEARLFACRGGLTALLPPVVALSLRAREESPVRPSFALAWRGLGAGLGLVLALVLLALFLALGSIASPAMRALSTGGLFLLVVGTLLLLPARRLQGVFKTVVAKHLFRHRYDYREQWMAFVDTIGRASGDDGPIHPRLAKAMADITGSSGALLLMPEGDGRFVPHGAWNWKGAHPQTLSLPVEWLARMRDGAEVIDIAGAREARAGALPPELAQDDRGWALVPLLHFDELIGVVLLGRPPLMRAPDWEDSDMLRTAGRQVASYIAEARGLQQLAEARRFEEFNRRFSFIIHDIKNLVSQIALVARNAERHADNPEFRADMILTLKDCTERMNRLLARLSQHNRGSEEEVERFALGDAARQVVDEMGGAHALLLEGDLSCPVVGGRGTLLRIVRHLVQNAIEASPGDEPVVLRVERAEEPGGGRARLSVIDYGCGMTAEFVRDDLFRPFVSTKASGFGIGAFEARALTRSLGGELRVESRPGHGSRFTMDLPLAPAGPGDEEEGETPRPEGGKAR